MIRHGALRVAIVRLVLAAYFAGGVRFILRHEASLAWHVAQASVAGGLMALTVTAAAFFRGRASNPPDEVVDTATVSACASSVVGDDR